MRNRIKPPFEAGDVTEAKSFQIGFRGAWFRCKVTRISKSKGVIGHVSKYYDYPEEKEKWEELYESPGKGKEKELMLRPKYPPMYKENQMPDVSAISEVTVIVRDSWKVGDLVDWWQTDCYWSGKITRLFDDDKGEIELKKPPDGEGEVYSCLLKDLRPSLDWSPQNGWSVPTQEGDNGGPCARLIKPGNQGQETKSGLGTAGPSVIASHSSQISSTSDVPDEVKSNEGTETQNRSLGTTVLSKEIAEDDLNSGYSPKYNLHSTSSDTLEAAIMDLEEYVSKVKRLKSMLHDGILSSGAASAGSRWEFVDGRATSEAPK